MVKCKVLASITTREEGIRKVYEKGSSIVLDEKEAERLVKEAVIEIVDRLEDDDKVQEVDYLDEKTLKKMNKEELIQYGLKIGIEVSKEMKNPEIVDSILDYIGEKESLGE
ncbi:hypothetical protein PBV87_15245 [Niameybacter massiliensis]|uniref:Uncharacterized protein n=1 Tax=Holtiella tumoricola TaxID=3018743 RepID=A0AA42DQB0_9FIRM|nr:hypothetical protein [Holtiella tumoricola]MDA3732831.1 hypothetical protein [Holtiella tumoricola]